MHIPRGTGRLAVAAAGVVALVAAFPATAVAGRHKPVSRPFVAHGLVVSHTAGTVTMLASDVRSGRTKATKKTITVALPSRRTGAGKALANKLARLKSGDRIAVSGTQRAGELTAKNIAGTPAPFHAYLGTISAIDGTLVTVTKAAQPSDDAGETEHGSFTVDISAATVTVDGAPGDLAVGQTAAILGSSVHDEIVATSVFAYAVAPASIAGEVTDVTGAVATVGTSDQEDGEDGGAGGGTEGTASSDDESDPPAAPAGTAVDLTNATLIVDGTSGATPDLVTVGARLLALGTDNGDGTFTATIAFAFTHACSSRHHGDGGQDSGEDD